MANCISIPVESFLMSEHMLKLGVVKMGMSFEFVSGSVARSPRRFAHWNRLEEKKKMTYCGSPSFYANCAVFKIKPSSSRVGRDQKTVNR